MVLYSQTKKEKANVVTRLIIKLGYLERKTTLINHKKDRSKSRADFVSLK